MLGWSITGKASAEHGSALQRLILNNSESNVALRQFRVMLQRNKPRRITSMSAQFNDFSSYTQQFAAAANRANRLALENAESVFGVQLRTFERNTTAAAGFLGELAQAGAQADLQALLPKGLQVARDNLERLANANQEVLGLSLKTGEALGELVRQPFVDAAGKGSRKTR